MAWLHKIAPKKFCRYSLRFGSICVGVLMCVIMVLSIIAAAVQVVTMKDCRRCPQYTTRNAYGFSCLAVLCYVFMLIATGWFLWGVKKEKASVVLGYVVVSVMWLAQTLGLVMILICLYSFDIDFIVSLLCLVFGLIAFGILVYSLLIVFGYWLELKATVSSRQVPSPELND